MYLYFSNAPIIGTAHTSAEPLVVHAKTGRIVSVPQKKHHKQIIDCAGYMLLPGLINAHDHLELNHFPRTRFRVTYPNAHVWGEDVSRRLDTAPYKALRQKSLEYQCWVGGIKNLLSGVTTVAHHNPYHRPCRDPNFPVRVLKDYHWLHSLHFSTEAEIRRVFQKRSDAPVMIHLAEGIDAIAAAEYRQLEAVGGIQDRTVLIHGVGLTAADIDHAVNNCRALVWCPSTNNYLLGKTATVAPWADAQKLLLGSDSRLTADGDLLDELRAAYQTQQVSAETLFHSVSDWAANALGLHDIGRLEHGNIADFIVLPIADNPFQALIESQRGDIGLVVQKGRGLYGDAALIEQFQPERAFSDIKIDGQPKRIRRNIQQQITRLKIMP